MFDALVTELSDRYGLGDRGRELFGLLVGYAFNDRRGGFDGFIEGFRQQGQGDLVSSWLGDARDARPANASDVGMVFGQGLLNDWANRLGTSRATIAAAIAGVLPRLVAGLAPHGRIPGGHATVLPYERLRDQADPLPATDAPAGAMQVDSVRPEPVPVDGDRPFAERVAAIVPDPIGAIVPGDGVILPDGREVHDPSRAAAAGTLRREPVFIAPTPMHAAPVRGNSPTSYAPRTRVEPATTDRAADMAAAFSSAHAGPHAEEVALGDVEFRRPVQATPQRRSRAWMWLLLLGMIIGAGWVAWHEGWLAPYIDLGALQRPAND